MEEKDRDNSSHLSPEAAQELMRSLLHKEGTWVDWGKHCLQLQKSGYDAQTIFEATGFQASQQNLIIIAAQVYESLVKAAVSEDTLAYYQGPKSDILYELRILTQEQRASAAELAKEKKLEFDTTKEVAKAIQEFSRFAQTPAGFTNDPGDAVAYQYWKRAKQKKDLQDRARLIAQGLKFARSQAAREAIEKLLSDFTVAPTQAAPLIPIYRLEAEEELARIVSFAGSFPLTVQDLQKIAPLKVEEPFRITHLSSGGAVISLPGWQIILKAEEPISILCNSDRLPKPLPGKIEEVLVVVDLAYREWDINSYFLVEQQEQLTLQWFEEEPNIPILGQVLLVVRPKKILDENNILEPWQMDD
jgi:Rubisco Assembly chaperone C-terminal domain/Rubisco accumulation factor 1 alpha helical domain/Rubisco accumulation factor 1 helix turn helix domain